jgi:glycosyltransferase involved in cell wall biosynthesis
MVEIHKKHPDVKLVIAGKGQMYFDNSKFSNLEYFEIINEYIPLPRLANLLHFCEFTVCPYIDATQSGVILTSFSSNTPVVVSNVGALPAMVNNGTYGKVVPPKDVNSLTTEICNLLDNPEYIQIMRDNISNLWRPSMSWEEIADVYIKEYERISKDNG